jgi:hypothetical protein
MWKAARRQIESETRERRINVPESWREVLYVCVCTMPDVRRAELFNFNELAL